jgi:arylformamidase
MRVIDLTHPISGEMPVYFPWHPGTQLEQTATYAEEHCVVHRLSIGTHSGTHIDAPSHIFEGMPTIDRCDPSLWCLDAQVLDFTPRRPCEAITVDEIRAKSPKAGAGIILKTGWDIFFGREDYYRTYPPLSNEAAEYLAGQGIPLIAADTPFTLDVHKILLRRGIPLVTNINNTSCLREGMVKLIAAPLLIRNGDGAPARVLALV